MPVKRETDFRYPDPVNQDWVRENLLLLGTTCEVEECRLQAVYAHVADRTAVYLCETHRDRALKWPSTALLFEQRMLRWFQSLFSFYSQAAASFGELLVELEERQKAEADADKRLKDDKERARKEFLRDLRKYNREEFADVKVGAPEDGLVESRGGPRQGALRGAQSAPRTQPVLRIAELEPIGPVILPPKTESGLTFMPGLL